MTQTLKSDAADSFVVICGIGVPHLRHLRSIFLPRQSGRSGINNWDTDTNGEQTETNGGKPL
jgi:hypothetical protein